MFKKITRFLSVVFSLPFILLIAPFFFKDTIKEKTLEWVNNHVTAEVAFDNIQLSFLSNFTKVQIVRRSGFVVRELIGLFVQFQVFSKPLKLRSTEDPQYNNGENRWIVVS